MSLTSPLQSQSQTSLAIQIRMDFEQHIREYNYKYTIRKKTQKFLVQSGSGLISVTLTLLAKFAKLMFQGKMDPLADFFNTPFSPQLKTRMIACSA